jgi:multiple sugar transport system substrate-binding protein
MATPRARVTRRQMLRAGAGALFVPFALKAGKAPAQGGKKPFEGVTLNISCWSATYPKLIADYIPEFTEKTGIKVNYDTPGFLVYNQRADLELSTKGSGFDVLNVTFIYTSRWIGAGWLTPLDSYLKDPNKTPADWDFADLLTGSVQPMRDKAGAVYGIPWISDVLMAASSRFDIFKANGLGMPGQLRGARQGDAGRQQEGGRERLLDREPLGLDIHSLPAGLWRQRLPQSA